MGQLVYTFHPNGSIEGLLKDKVLDTRIFGDRHIERITIIEHSESAQAFYVRWLKGPNVGHVDGHLFKQYEEAVEYEIAEVNKLRLAGHIFG